MIYTVTSPVGIDIPIKNLQRYLYDTLISLWGITESQVRSFPRGMRIDGKVRFFDTSKYVEADGLMDDAYALQYFFLAPDRRDFTSQVNITTGSHFVVPVEIYFFVNLLTVKSSLTTIRADEQVKQDVFNVIFQGSGNFQYFDTIENSLFQSEEVGDFNEKMDIQPNHSFKAVTNLIYRYDKTF